MADPGSDVHLHLAIPEADIEPATGKIKGFSSDPAAVAIYDRWYDLLCNHTYAGRLSRTSDKLPALSEISGHIQTLTNSEYLVGLWLEDISRDYIANALRYFLFLVYLHCEAHRGTG